MQAEAPGLWVLMGGGPLDPRRVLNTEQAEINTPWNAERSPALGLFFTASPAGGCGERPVTLGSASAPR
ncbi:unnamed protein product [Boreogadus saida]